MIFYTLRIGTHAKPIMVRGSTWISAGWGITRCTSSHQNLWIFKRANRPSLIVETSGSPVLHHHQDYAIVRTVFSHLHQAATLIVETSGSPVQRRRYIFSTRTTSTHLHACAPRSLANSFHLTPRRGQSSFIHTSGCRHLHDRVSLSLSPVCFKEGECSGSGTGLYGPARPRLFKICCA